MNPRTLTPSIALGAVALAVTLRVASQVPPDPGAAAPPSPARPYDHVVIVSFDGMRPDGMLQAQAPTLHRMRAEGAYATAAETVGDSSTLPSHSSMLTGVEVREHGMTFDDFRPHRGFIRVPTVMYRARDAGLATAMFVAKAKLRHMAIPGSLDVWSLPSYRCERVASAAAEYLATARPGITFIHFGEPDGAGHRRRWMSAAYLEAIARTDACFAQVLAPLEARADRDRILVIVSADHGGHGRRHGSHDPQDLHIPWIAWGSRVARGDFTDPVRTTDTGVTALAALGLPVPAELTGRVISRVWEGGALEAGAPPTDASADAP
ncbi:MAG: alkaline phosphatase family protein [Polyangiales bacterium]